MQQLKKHLKQWFEKDIEMSARRFLAYYIAFIACSYLIIYLFTVWKNLN